MSTYHRDCGRSRAEHNPDLSPGCPSDTKQFHRTVLTVEVISEEPLPGDADIMDVLTEADQGSYLLGWSLSESGTLSGEEAAAAATRLGSDPTFFYLSEDGKYVADY